MVKAGVQQMALPDIYKMFKTASDEDKIKLMNTYSNLGERLGERDKDIDYRRGRGDKSALTEKMYTEGIGDVVGSAWDYTKQGAETAWDYAKKGAKKGAESLRDLVMRDTAVNDLVRGDEYIEEEQLPTNNTPPRVELGGAEEALPSQEHMLLGYGPDSIMERNLRDRLNGLNLEQYPYADNPDTEQKYPAFEPENVFESTMARNLRDRLNGLNLKQYPYDDDWESTNSSTGADVEKEEETLSPQEQRFLGADVEKEEETLSPQEQRFLGLEPEKEEAPESPMARRMRERLEKLTAQQEQYADNPDARWSDMYNIDPERASFDYGIEKDEMSRNSQVYTPAQKSLIDAKQQNRIRMGEIQGTINSLKTETEREPWITQLNALQERDIDLNNQLAELGTLGYKQMETIAKQTTPENTGDLTPISPTKNSKRYLDFANLYDPVNYANVSDVPSATTIQAQAREAAYDLSQEDAKTLHAELKDKVEQRTKEKQTEEDRKYQREEENRKRTAFKQKLADDKAALGALRLAYDSLNADPNDITSKSSALTSILRKESGAAIGDSEFMGRMKEWLSPADYEALQDELSGIGMLVAGKISPNAADLWTRKISDKYLGKVDGHKMIKFLNYIIPDYAKEDPKPKPAPKPTPTYPQYKTMESGRKYVKKSATSTWEPVK